MTEKEKALKNIQTAVMMYDSSHLLFKVFQKEVVTEKKDGAASYLITANVLAAFGIENALKALIRREGKDLKNIHNLRALYDLLSPSTQKRVQEKGAAYRIPMNEKTAGIRVEGVIDEHQETFQEWRYRESAPDLLPTLPGILTDTLWLFIETHNERYGKDAEREQRQKAGQESPGASARIMQYAENVLLSDTAN